MLNSYTEYFKKARTAGRQSINPAITNQVLKALAIAAVAQTDHLLKENKKDLDRMDPNDPKYDRLKLTAGRIKDIANEINNVAELKSPLGNILSKKIRPNGLQISKIRVPLGIVGVIYEARPNV